MGKRVDNSNSNPYPTGDFGQMTNSPGGLRTFNIIYTNRMGEYDRRR
jgi:hypothetical protein